MIQAIADIAACTVDITGSTSGGTGTIYKHGPRNSWVLSCAHIFAEGDKVAEIESGKNKYKARIIALDRELDMSILKTTKRVDAPAIEFAPNPPTKYDRVYPVGNGLDIIGLASEGIYMGMIDGCYCYTGIATPGMSGGCLGDYNGQMLGVIKCLGASGETPVFNVGYTSTLPEVIQFTSEKGNQDHGERKRSSRSRNSIRSRPHARGRSRRDH